MSRRAIIQSHPDWQTPRVADAVATSTTPPTDIAGGIRFTVPGGGTTTDPGDGIWAAWPLYDILGRRAKTGTVQPFDLFTFLLFLKEIAPPSLTSDSWVGIGIAGTSALGGSANALFGAIKYSASIRAARAGGIAAGTASVTDDGTPQGDLRSIMVDSLYTFGSQFGTVAVTGFDSTGLNIFGNFDTTSRGVNAALGTTPADPHIFVAAGRTAATGGDAVIDVMPRFQALALGKVPF